MGEESVEGIERRGGRQVKCFKTLIWEMRRSRNEQATHLKSSTLILPKRPRDISSDESCQVSVEMYLHRWLGWYGRDCFEKGSSTSERGDGRVDLTAVEICNAMERVDLSPKKTIVMDDQALQSDQI